MRKSIPQLNLLLVPLMTLMIGFMAVMPVAAAESCSTAMDAAGGSITVGSHESQFQKQVMVDPCEKAPIKQQNDIIVNFAMPLNIGATAPDQTIALESIARGPILASSSAPPGHVPLIFSPPPIA